MAEARAREAASEGSIWRFLVEMAPTVEMQPPRDTYSQVTSLTPPLLHGHTIGGFSSQGSAARRQTRPASSPRLLRVAYAAAVLAHRDHTLRAESAAARRSLGVESGPCCVLCETVFCVLGLADMSCFVFRVSCFVCSARSRTVTQLT